MKNLFRFSFMLVVLLSGFCSLVYQVIWDRLARYNFGGDNTSATIVIAVFLLGLGIGAYIFRRVKSHHLLIYGLVEIGIGAFALVSFSLISNIELSLAQLFEITVQDLSGIRLLTVVGCIFFFLPPCILMGGTLPLMFGGFFARQDFLPRELSLVYSANIFGAVGGAFAVPYFLLNNLSIPNALALMATVNFIIGIISILIHLTIKEYKTKDLLSSSSLTQVRGALWVTFITGLVTSIIEIVFIRHAFDLIPSSPYNFSFVIGMVLFSLGMGSLILPSRKWAQANPSGSICILLFAAAAGLLTVTSLSGFVSSKLLIPDLEHLKRTILYFLLLCFPVFFPIGGIFPILCSTESTSKSSISSRTGLLYIWNSVGAFAGAIFFHYIGINLIGTHGVIILLLYFLSLTALWLNKSALLKSKMFKALAMTISIASLWMQMRVFAYGNNVASADFAFIEEGTSGIAAIAWNNPHSGIMLVNGQNMGTLPNEPKHALQFGVAMSVIPEPKHVLIMGLGSGSYVRYLLSTQSVETVTIVDWSNEIPRLLAKYEVIEKIGNTVSDPRIKIITGDARLAVALLPPASFDLIIDNLAYPTWVGATGIRSSWYFQNIAKLLSPRGAYAITTNYARWRNEILAGLQRNFIGVYENAAGYMVLATNNPTVKVKKEVCQKLSEKYWRQSPLSSHDYKTMLTDGLLKTKQNLTEQPFQEDQLFSEYYYSSREFLRFLSR